MTLGLILNILDTKQTLHIIHTWHGLTKVECEFEYELEI